MLAETSSTAAEEGAVPLGIKDLAVEGGRGMPVDRLIDILEPSLRGKLFDALEAKGPNGNHLITPREIVDACADDGFMVTERSIRTWRERNADR